MDEKLYLLLLLTVSGCLASSHVAGSREKDVVYPPFDCQGVDGRQPNPYDCASFYECITNMAILIRCPSGQLYNSAKAACDYPQNVDCSYISALPPVEETTVVVVTSAPISEFFTCPASDGYFADPEMCDVFWICYQGVPDRHDCPAGLVYNPEIFACDYPSNVPPPCGTQCSLPLGNCESTTAAVTTSTTTTPTTTTKPPFTCPTQDGFYPNPYDCSSYYVCDQFNAFLLECSPGLVYNPNVYTCDYSYNVPPPCGTCTDCPGGGTTARTTNTPAETTPTTSRTGTTPTTTRPTGGGPFDCPEANGYFADPDSCTSFFICYNWVSNIRYCAEGLVFNPAKDTCDYPENVPPPCGTGRRRA